MLATWLAFCNESLWVRARGRGTSEMPIPAASFLTPFWGDFVDFGCSC